MQCVAGCRIYYGGEIRHNKDCPYYPESLSKMYDELEDKANQLEKLVRQCDFQPMLLMEINELLKEQQKTADIYKGQNYHPYSQGQEFGKLFAYKKIQQLILSKQST